MFGRRLASALSVVALALGGAAMATSPAHATDPGCSTGVGHYEQAGGFITGYRYRFCDGQPDVALYVTVHRYMSPGVYQLVASGMGEATYYCAGSNFGRYRAATQTDFDIMCT